MRVIIALIAALSASAALAQDAPTGLAEAKGAVLRGLDKVAGTAADIDIAVGQSVDYGQIRITLNDCRYPPADPSSNAYAFVTVVEKDAAPVFSGWMIADSPALSAVDHQRYDVWAIRCKTE